MPSQCAPPPLVTLVGLRGLLSTELRQPGLPRFELGNRPVRGSPGWRLPGVLRLGCQEGLVRSARSEADAEGALQLIMNTIQERLRRHGGKLPARRPGAAPERHLAIVRDLIADGSLSVGPWRAVDGPESRHGCRARGRLPEPTSLWCACAPALARPTSSRRSSYHVFSPAFVRACVRRVRRRRCCGGGPRYGCSSR